VSLLRRALHERESVPVEETTETIREVGCSEQVMSKVNSVLFLVLKYAEQELFMFK
jgi:hypothetical protein